MSKSIYLSKLKIKNFRTYGCDVELDLPAEPGLLIVCGMNGLGKTAFFDAMEWALTGDVQRLHEKLGKSCEKELTRDGVTPGMHGVELFFSEGNPIARGPNASCDKTSIINLLKHPEWEPEIRDIRPYLRLTHFLPQSSMQRFLEKDEGDQWKRLEGPAGVERLERLRKLLNDPKARNAFTRRIDTLTREWMDAQKSLKEWEQRVVAWQDLRSMASANDAISPAQLDAAINAIWNRIADADVGNPPPLLTASTPVEKLGALKTLIEKQLLVAQDLGRKIPVAEQTLMDWNSLNSRKGAEKAKREAAQKAIPAREWAIAEALGPIEAIRNTVHRFEKEKSEAEETAGLLLQIINNLERTGELETTLRLTAGKIEALTVETSTKQTERDNIEKLRRQREDAIQKQIRVRKTQMAFEAAAQRYAELTETIKAAEFAANNRAKLLSSQADVAQRKEKAEAERRRLEEYIQDVRNHLAAEKLAADAIGRAVVEIAQRLTEHDTICPVCSHSHGPGELLEEARKSMARARTGSDTLAGNLEVAQRNTKGVEETIKTADREATAISEKLNEISQLIDKERALRSEVESLPQFAGRRIETLANCIEQDRSELQRQYDAIVVDLTELPAFDQLDANRVEFENAYRGLTEQHRRLMSERQAVQSQLDQIAAFLEQHQQIISSNGGTITELQSTRNQSLSRAANGEIALSEPRRNLAVAEKRLQDAETTLSELKTQESAATKELNELDVTTESNRRIWENCGLAGDPSEAELRRQMAHVANSQTTLESLLERQRSLVKRLEAWMQNENLRKVSQEVEEMLKEAGQSDISSVTQILEEKVATAEARKKHAQAAREHAETIANALTRQSSKFTAEALKPLSERITAFNQVISPFHFDFRIGARQTASRAARTERFVNLENPGTGKSKEHDPQARLSEGQISALGLSVLCGASTIYRWSRWPALLLDDPFQNADLIHTAAFIDVIRSMMRENGFQVIISTHDLQQADFLARKCCKANLPVTRFELLGLGKDGVRYKVN